MVRRSLSLHTRPVVLIAIGGMLGANLRYSLGAVAGEGFLITIVVNGVGSFGLGLLLFDTRADDLLSKRFRHLFGTGFFASFTTYSTFIADIGTAGGLAAIGYIAASYGAGIGGVLLSRNLVNAYSVTGVADPELGDD